MGGDAPAVFQTGVSSPNAPLLSTTYTLRHSSGPRTSHGTSGWLVLRFGLALRRRLARTLGLRPGSLQRPRLLFRGPHSAYDPPETVVHHLVEALWGQPVYVVAKGFRLRRFGEIF